MRVLRGWQIGGLFGLGIGLIQAMRGDLELATLSVGEGVARLAMTMIGAAVFCGVAAHLMTATARSVGGTQPPDTLSRSQE